MIQAVEHTYAHIIILWWIDFHFSNTGNGQICKNIVSQGQKKDKQKF